MKTAESERTATVSTLDVRGDFPIFARRFDGRPLIYLDSGATSQKPAAVIHAVSSYMSERNANVHRGVYALAQESDAAYDEARIKVAKFARWDPTYDDLHEERDRGDQPRRLRLGPRERGPGDAVLTTQMEHHANIVPWQQLCREQGAELRYLEVDERGELSLDQFDRELARGDVKLVAFTHVSNVLGTILPVAEMSARVRAAGAVSLVDGAQAVPHMPVDAKALGADFYAWTGHKALGPTGIGVLHGRAEILEEMEPFMTGGDMIASVDFDGATWNELPFKFEAGTPPIAEAVGPRRCRRLSVGPRDGAREGTRARADRLPARPLGGDPRIALRRPTRGRESRRPGVVHDRGHARTRHRRAGQPRWGVHPRRSSLRATVDALSRRIGHGQGERGRVQRAG